MTHGRWTLGCWKRGLVAVAAFVLSSAGSVSAGPATSTQPFALNTSDDFILYRSVHEQDPRVLDLHLVGAPAGPVRIELFVGTPGPGDTGRILDSTWPEGTRVVQLPRQLLQFADRGAGRRPVISARALVIDTEGRAYRSNVTILTERPNLHLLLESSSDRSQPVRLVRYDPQRDELVDVAEGLTGHSSDITGASELFELHAPTGAVFYVPDREPSILQREGLERDPSRPTGFGEQRIVDLAFTPDTGCLLALTRRDSAAGSSLMLYALELDPERAEQVSLKSSGVLFSTPTGECDAWLVSSDHSGKVLVAIRSDDAVDRIQQWVVNGSLHEGRGIAPIARSGESLEDVVMEGEYVATVAADRRGGRFHLRLFHLCTRAWLVNVELPGEPRALDLVSRGSEGVEVHVLSDLDGGTLFGWSVESALSEAQVREPRTFRGARDLASSATSDSLFMLVGLSDRSMVMRIDRLSWQSAEILAPYLPAGAADLSLIGDAGEQWLSLLVPEVEGSRAHGLVSIPVNPITGKLDGGSGDIVRRDLGATVTRKFTRDR